MQISGTHRIQLQLRSLIRANKTRQSAQFDEGQAEAEQ